MILMDPFLIQMILMDPFLIIPLALLQGRKATIFESFQQNPTPLKRQQWEIRETSIVIPPSIVGI
jgi:hypothetical protein